MYQNRIRIEEQKQLWNLLNNNNKYNYNDYNFNNNSNLLLKENNINNIITNNRKHNKTKEL